MHIFIYTTLIWYEWKLVPVEGGPDNHTSSKGTDKYNKETHSLLFFFFDFRSDRLPYLNQFTKQKNNDTKIFGIHPKYENFRNNSSTNSQTTSRHYFSLLLENKTKSIFCPFLPFCWLCSCRCGPPLPVAWVPIKSTTEQPCWIFSEMSMLKLFLSISSPPSQQTS